MAKQSKLSIKKKSKGYSCKYKTPSITLKKNIKANKKENCLVIKCCSNPTYATSTTYNLLIMVFKDRNPEDQLKWVNNVKRAKKGQNMTT